MQVVEFKTVKGTVVTCCVKQLFLLSVPYVMKGRHVEHKYTACVADASWYIDEGVWRSLREQMKGGLDG